MPTKATNGQFNSLERLASEAHAALEKAIRTKEKSDASDAQDNYFDLKDMLTLFTGHDNYPIMQIGNIQLKPYERWIHMCSAGYSYSAKLIRNGLVPVNPQDDRESLKKLKRLMIRKKEVYQTVSRYVVGLSGESVLNLMEYIKARFPIKERAA